MIQCLHNIYTLMLQRLAIANGYGWNRFLHTVDQVLPRRGDTLPLPLMSPLLMTRPPTETAYLGRNHGMV